MKNFVFLFISIFFSCQIYAQSDPVTGTVKDINNTPLIGVNVIEKGTNNGTTTDFDGNFSITLTTDNPILEFSFLGFISQNKEVNAGQTLNIVLEDDISKLNEVVVVGYGQKEKGAVTGAISSVEKEAFEKRPVANTFEP